MNEKMFPATSVRPSARKLTLLLIALFCLSGWLGLTAAEAAPRKRATAQQRRAQARHAKHKPQRRAARLKQTHRARFDEASAGIEFDEESGEEVQRREEWFTFQRAYPYAEPPADGRRLAWEARPRGAGDKDGDPFLTTAATAGTPMWRAIGPTPTTPAFPANWGMTSGRINAIAISPANPQLILVGASTGGIWRSTDGGTNFTPVSDSQIDLSVGSIAFSRSNPSIVYAGMGDLYNSYLGTGVLKSTDAGLTWARVNNTSLPSPATTAEIEVSPVDPNRVYLLQYVQYNGNANNETFASGLWVSTDGGVNWTRRFAGLLRDIAVHPTNPQIMYLGVRRADSPTFGQPGLYKSTDGGNTWAITYNSTLGPYTNSTRIDMRIGVTPAAPDTVYIFTGNTISPNPFELRVEVSTDAGQTWTNRSVTGIDPGQLGYNAYIAVSPADASTLYIGTRDVYKSTDGGQTWSSVTRNFVYNGSSFPYNPFGSRSHPDQHAFAFAPNDANTIYLGNDGGLSKSADGGNNIQSLNATLGLSQFVGIAMHPTDPTFTVGGTQDNGTQFRSATGSGWKEFAEGDGGHPVISATDPSIVFSTYVFGAIRAWRFNADGTRTEMNRRTSNTTFGESNSNGRINFYAPFTNNGVDATLYFGTWRLFVSTTYADPNTPINSNTWTAPGGTTELTKGGPDVLNAIGVARTAYSNTQVIYTGSELGRAMVTSDGGTTWTDISAGLPVRVITSIRVDPVNSSVAYLTVSGYGSGHIFKTVNRGANWTNISGNLPNIPVNDTLIDPVVPTTLYAATDIGVFRSTTGGSVWETYNQGMPPTVVTGFTTNQSGRIQIATYGRGAYELAADAPGPSSVQFSQLAYNFGEGATSAVITITRTGDTSAAATVDFSTTDDPAEVRCDDIATKPGVAFARCDYATTIDTITFGAGQTTQTVTVPLIDDAHVEGGESLQLRLANPSGAVLGAQTTATLALADNDVPGQQNPIFNNNFFVRQHYLDFLSREPDAPGQTAWLDVLNNCPDVNNNPACDRILVSSSFFGSQEFQLKGYFVYRFYKLAFNRLPQYGEIIPDMRAVTGQTAQEVFTKKATFTNAFVQRQEFASQYGTLSNSAYVAVLMSRYGLTQVTTPDPAAPDSTTKVTLTSTDLTNRLDAQTLTRAQVLRAVADSDQVFTTEFNPAFVAMQYYGYLRRTPEPSGYQAWLNYLNAHPSDFRTMVNGFMNSAEYRLRFGTGQ